MLSYCGVKSSNEAILTSIGKVSHRKLPHVLITQVHTPRTAPLPIAHYPYCPACCTLPTALQTTHTGCPQKKFLSELSSKYGRNTLLGHFGPFWLFWANLDQIKHSGPFGPCWAILDHFGPFGPCWAILGHFGSFGPFWALLAIWAFLGHLGHFGPFGPFWAIWAILGHLGHLGQFGSLGHLGYFGPFVPNFPKSVTSEQFLQSILRHCMVVPKPIQITSTLTLWSAGFWKKKSEE